MTRLRVDLDALAELTDRLARFEQQLAAVHADADRHVDALRVTWSGEAATRQHAAHARWSAAARDLHEALVALRRIGSTAHANYAAAAAANRRMWRA